MSVSFGEKNAAEFYFGDIAAAEIYFGNVLVWSGKRLLMGNTKNVCIEFMPETDIIASSQNPVTISVFMNTDSYTTTNPPMWVKDAAGITVGFSNVGTVGSEEVIKKQSGYKRTNTFTDNMLFLTAGKRYYICYQVDYWDDKDHYFAYYNKGEGNYKQYNVGNESTAAVNLAAYNDIGELGKDDVFSGVDAAIAASENDLFIWQGPILNNSLSVNGEYVRNNVSYTAYDSTRNCDKTDKADVLWNIMLAGQGRTFLNYPSYSTTTSGFLQRSNQYTAHANSLAKYGFNSNADAFKFIFDQTVGLTAAGVGVVWANNYVYTSGTCYVRGQQYLNSHYYGEVNAYSALGQPSANELFYGTFKYHGNPVGLAERTSEPISAVAIGIPNNFTKSIAAICVAGADHVMYDDADHNQYGTIQCGNVYSLKTNYINKITSITPLSEEPSSPAVNGIYYKDNTHTWGNINGEAIVSYNGNTWVEVYSYQLSNWFDTTALNNIFSFATTGNILNAINDTDLYQTVNISNLFTSIQGSQSFANATVSSDKKHYLEINGVEV